MTIEETDAIHNWFELSYAQYLTIPRSVLQSMPDEWQARFVQCLRELDEAIDWRPSQGAYRVQLMTTKLRYSGYHGHYVEKWDKVLDDPLMDYERGRRWIPHRSGEND